MSYVNHVIIILWGMIVFATIGAIYEIVDSARKLKTARPCEREGLKNIIVMYSFVLVMLLAIFLIAFSK